MTGFTLALTEDQTTLQTWLHEFATDVIRPAACTTLGVAGILSNGTQDQIAEWVPQCFGTESDVRLAALAVSEPNAGSGVSGMKTTAVYDAAAWRGRNGIAFTAGEGSMSKLFAGEAISGHQIP